MAINNPVPQKKSTLDTVANIAIIVVCAIAAVVLIRNQFFPKQAAGPGNMPQIEKGEKYAQLKDVVPAGSNRALVVAVQPGCHFCNDSMPFYKRLLDERNQKGSAVKFVAALYKDAMTSEVLSWNDASNNQYIDSGVGSFIVNPISARVAANATSARV